MHWALSRWNSLPHRRFLFTVRVIAAGESILSAGLQVLNAGALAVSKVGGFRPARGVGLGFLVALVVARGLLGGLRPEPVTVARPTQKSSLV